MPHGFIKEADVEETTYRGYLITVRSGEIIVHHPKGRTKARFTSMAAARAFVRWLRREDS